MKARTPVGACGSARRRRFARLIIIFNSLSVSSVSVVSLSVSVAISITNIMIVSIFKMLKGAVWAST